MTGTRSENCQENCQKIVNGDIADAKRLGRPTKITKTKERVGHLAINQKMGIRSAVKKLNFSEDFQARNKKVGVTTVRLC